MRRMCRFVVVLVLIAATAAIAEEGPIPETSLLDWEGDLARKMVDGLHADIDRRTLESRANRLTDWTDSGLTTPFARAKRDKLSQILGAVDQREPVYMETVAAPGEEGPVATGPGYRVYAVRWPAYAGACGEGLLVEPDGVAIASLVLIPDAGQGPENVLGLQGDANAYGAILAAQGVRVLVPVIVDREDTWSGTPGVRMTNQPHREWIYRGAYEMGRHIIGYELQKIFSAVDWLQSKAPGTPLGLVGYGEGGLLALHTAALDTRIKATVVSGYFGPREDVWQEPIYHNVWSLLTDFGDAELAALVAPRTLIVEPSAPPAVSGPPQTEGRSQGAAPGAVPRPSPEAIRGEVDRAASYAPDEPARPWLQLAGEFDGSAGQAATLARFWSALGLGELESAPAAAAAVTALPDASARMKRQVDGLLGWTDAVLAKAPEMRQDFWKDADDSSVARWVETTKAYRQHFHEQIIGKLPDIVLPPNARTRQVYDTDAYLGYEVVLDVYDDVFAYGLLLVPKGIQDGERRPVVVCQHGLEGRPQDVADPAINNHYYGQYGCKLAEGGFVVYAPQNPYIGEDHFRTVQRKANPLGLSLFSYIIEQHRQTLKWLGSLPFVDADRIAFYGLSYGGKTAMRVPAVLDEYCLSICSGDFNEWIWKNVTRQRIYSYMFHGEYEMFEWNLGETFNYAELSWLICPRPFMVERGHWDGVAPDEWVGHEFALVRNRYDLLGLTDETRIEWFNGPHQINGVGTFQFLRDKLNFARKR